MLGVVLVVDPAPGMAEAMAAVLQLEGYRVCVASDAGVASELARRERPDIVLIDPEVCGVSALRLSEEFRRWGLAPAFVMLCNESCPSQECILPGVATNLCKPFTLRQLLTAIASTMNRQQTAAGLARECVLDQGPQAAAVRAPASLPGRAITPLQWAFAPTRDR